MMVVQYDIFYSVNDNNSKGPIQFEDNMMFTCV